MPASLSNLAKSFQLDTMKGIFPHLFNTIENYDYVGPLPPKTYFDLKFYAKNQNDVESFDKWYETRKNFVWNFKTELTNYCRDDVKILGKLVKIFHDICVSKFDDSPWSFATAPSYVHSVVIRNLSRNLEMPEDREERAAIITRAIESHWVALVPHEYWFVRKALRGGRTDVRKLRHILTNEEKARGCTIKYVDVVSMYPAVQVKYDYPVGAPKVIVYDQDYYPCKFHQNPPKGNDLELRCNCPFSKKFANRDAMMDIVYEPIQPTEEFLKSVFGFICVTCEPPKHLYHPVLVTWDNERDKCVATLETIHAQVFTTEEFKFALEKGYKVIKVHRIDVYKRKPGLWNDFIKDLYIEKLATSDPEPTDVEKQRLSTYYEEYFGMGEAVNQSFSRWRYDGAMRTVYKTLLNCGWGKHCQRPNLSQHVVVNADDPQLSLYDDVQAGVQEITHIDNLVNGYQCITTSNTSQKPPNTHHGYIPAGCYVPAYGRLTLLREMDKLGDRVLYHDTDSIIYIDDPTQYNIPRSDIWGSWDEEGISKKGIDAFVSLGPKSYAIKAGIDEIIKLKGLSVKYSHRNMITFDSISNFIDEHVNENYPQLQIPQMTFQYKVGNGITTRNFLKVLKFDPSTLKGQLSSSLKIYPDGYCQDCIHGRQCNH